MKFLLAAESHQTMYVDGKCNFKLQSWLRKLHNKEIVFIPFLWNKRWKAMVLWADPGKPLG